MFGRSAAATPGATPKAKPNTEIATPNALRRLIAHRLV
jgi:hypothetical protein